MRRNSETCLFYGHNHRLLVFLFAVSLISLSLTHLIVGCDSKPSDIQQHGVIIPTEHISPTKATQPEVTEIAPSPVLQSAPKTSVVETGIGVPANLNPLLADGYAARHALDPVFDSLLKINAQNATLLPGLATEWEISEDASSITFHLRAGVSWHDGQPFSAKDVEFTFESIQHPASESPFRANLINVKHFSALDAHTFVVTLKRPNCSTLYAIGQIPIISQHYFEAVRSESESDTAANLRVEQAIGTGPYRFKAKLPTGEIHLERNEGYFAGVPQIPEWIYRPADDQAQILHSLQAGETDLANIPPESLELLQQTGSLRFAAFPQSEYYFLALNNEHPFLNDPLVRQALAQVIDRVQLVEEILKGYGQVVESSWLSDHWAYTNPEVSFPYNMEQAIHRFEEAGWTDSDGDGFLDKNGTTLEISIAVNAENDLRKRIALAVQRDWMAAGIATEIHFVEARTLLEKLFAHNFDAVVFSWPIHPDPDQQRLWASAESDLEGTFNFISYANPAVDEALAQGLTAPACRPELRAQAYQTAISSITSEQPYIFLFVPHHILAVNRRLSGLELGPYADPAWNIEDWRLEAHTE